MPLRLAAANPSFESEFSALLAAKREASEEVGTIVADIIENVRQRGDAALLEYTKRFDAFELTMKTMRVDRGEIDAARGRCDAKALSALETAARRIQAFHERLKPNDIDYTDAEGVRLGARWTAMESVGLYVPGGTAAYPSSVLMTAIPGIDEIYRVGGAQAIAALAYGTNGIASVVKIVGPGNAYVASAKRQVFGQVGIDMIAGPSEILVLADAENDPDWIAADLLSQAEHDEAAQSILITDDLAFSERVSDAVTKQIGQLDRSDIAEASWRDNGAVILVDQLQDAVPLIDRIAPEHLALPVADPDGIAKYIRNAGAIFLGRFTPEAIGDYVAGPNHVLPTARSARFSSGLGVIDFMKRSTLMACDAESLAAIGPAAVALASAEGLGGHARSVSIRLNARPDD